MEPTETPQEARYTGKTSSRAISLAALRNSVDHNRFAALDDLERAPDGWRDVLRIGDGSDALHAIALRHRGVIDIRLDQLGSDTAAAGVAVRASSHGGHEHDLLMIA